MATKKQYIRLLREGASAIGKNPSPTKLDGNLTTVPGQVLQGGYWKDVPIIRRETKNGAVQYLCPICVRNNRTESFKLLPNKQKLEVTHGGADANLSKKVEGERKCPRCNRRFRVLSTAFRFAMDVPEMPELSS